MGVIAESWLAEARALGYKSEEEMLKDMYMHRHLSLQEMASWLGYSRINVRRRLLLLGVPLSRRGGSNKGKSVLSDLKDEEFSDVKGVMKKYQVSESTVHKEKKRRGLSRPYAIRNDGATGDVQVPTERGEPGVATPHGASTELLEE